MTDMLRELAEVVRTAPETIYLQVSDTDYDLENPFPDDHEGISWCQDSVMPCEVTYTRADIAAQNAEAVGKYQSLCASMYQVAGVYDMPVKFLDALFDAAQGEIEKRQKTDNLLPYYLPESEAAKRLRALEMALDNWDADYGTTDGLCIRERAEEIMRDWES